MEKRIDKIIKKAQIIKDCLIAENKKTGNIDGLIKSLESYRDNVGDIPQEKLYTFLVRDNEYLLEKLPFREYADEYPIKGVSGANFECVLGIKLIEFTTHIRQIIAKAGYNHQIIMWPSCEVLCESIADPVFDIQTYPIKDNTLLMTKLIEGGFKPTTTRIKYVCDFD